MKKILFLTMLLLFSVYSNAQLDFNIPFDLNYIDNNYDGSNNYTFESDEFEIINTGETSDYSFQFFIDSNPNDWSMHFCDDAGCHLVGFPWTVNMITDEPYPLHYSVNNIDMDGMIEFHLTIDSESLDEPIDVYFSYESQSSDSEENSISLPELHLNNYPNPFNPQTTISFSNNESQQAKIIIYNLKGKKIKTFKLNNLKRNGNHNVIWKGIDDNGNEVTSGIYLYKLITDKVTQIRKMILLK